MNHPWRTFAVILGSLIISVAAQAQDTASSAAPDLGLDSLLNTRVSTAAKYDQSVRQVAGSITVVTAEDIRRFGYRTLSDVLQSMAGVYTSNPRSYESIGVRGFGRPTDYNSRILLLIDGHSIFESMWGQAPLGDEQVINLDGVERIELVRGPSSALYGTGAMFAVINIISRKGDDLGSALLTAEGGSLGRRGGRVVLGTGNNRANIIVSGLAEEVDGQTDLFYPQYNDSTLR